MFLVYNTLRLTILIGLMGLNSSCESKNRSPKNKTSKVSQKDFDDKEKNKNSGLKLSHIPPIHYNNLYENENGEVDFKNTNTDNNYNRPIPDQNKINIPIKNLKNIKNNIEICDQVNTINSKPVKKKSRETTPKTVYLSSKKEFLNLLNHSINKFILQNEFVIKKNKHQIKIKNSELKKNINSRRKKTIYDIAIYYLNKILKIQKKIFNKIKKRLFEDVNYSSIYSFINVVRILNIVDYNTRICLLNIQSYSFDKESLMFLKDIVTELNYYSSSTEQYLNPKGSKLLKNFIKDNHIILNSIYFQKRVEEISSMVTFEGVKKHHIELNHLSLEYILRWCKLHFKQQDCDNEVISRVINSYLITLEIYKKHHPTF